MIKICYLSRDGQTFASDCMCVFCMGVWFCVRAELKCVWWYYMLTVWCIEKVITDVSSVWCIVTSLHWTWSPGLWSLFHTLIWILCVHIRIIEYLCCSLRLLALLLCMWVKYSILFWFWLNRLMFLYWHNLFCSAVLPAAHLPSLYYKSV